MVRKKIDINQVVADIKSGMSRRKKDDKGYGSIQAKYNLNTAELKLVCDHPKLKNKKISLPVEIDIIDEPDEQADFTVDVIMSAPVVSES